MASNADAPHAEDENGQAHKKINFHHPYTPYSIQEEFMQTVYNILQNGNSGPDGNASVGILESPTGTGKSLSLICASLTWLRDFKRRQFEDELNGEGERKDGDEPDWIIEAARARRRREKLRGREEMEARIRKAREKEAKMKKAMLKGEAVGFMGKKRRVEVGYESEKERGGDDEFVLDEYHSDGETNREEADPYSGFSREIRAMMEKNGLARKQQSDEDEEVDDEIKIFYCSRTHSQLTQFINEMRRVHIPPSLQPEPDPEKPVLEEEFKHLTLGSRKNLCINPAVNKLHSTTAINEKCSDLQQSSTPKDKRCSYLPNQENKPLVHDFRDRTLATVRDIEELGELGKEIAICPYYASRSAIKPAEIVTLPYPLLLQKSAREALGVSVKGHVVVVDEAHNLMDAIAGIYGVSVTLTQLRKSRAQLQAYLVNFGKKLAGNNRIYVAQVVRLIDSLARYLEKQEGKPEDVVVMADMMAGKGVDQINIYKLLHYLQESRLARKVEGYILSTENGEKEAVAVRKPKGEKHGDASEASAPTLHHVSSFLYALTNPDKEGRLFHSYDQATQETSLKYMLLDPTHHFQEIVSEARAVILAGGTMSPMSDYTSHLLSYMPKEKITTLSCGHVIPKENLLAWTLSSGPTGKPFEFTFAKRKGTEGEKMIDELGRALISLCLVVPDGVVVFFPSYAYLETVIKRWEAVIAPNTASVWEKFGRKKELFRESKDAKAGENVLSEYAAAIDANKGGLLLSVVGGKMSEGINFSDRLGRCVVIVGLPFPNIMSGEWKAKMAYIESSTISRMEAADEGTEASRKAAGKNEARGFYENACMRAVNQSVGRAIRHRQDFAAIVMVDIRFGRENIKGKLPGWIRSGLVEGCEEKPFRELMGGLNKFFRGKKMP